MKQGQEMHLLKIWHITNITTTNHKQMNDGKGCSNLYSPHTMLSPPQILKLFHFVQFSSVDVITSQTLILHNWNEAYQHTIGSYVRTLIDLPSVNILVVIDQCIPHNKYPKIINRARATLYHLQNKISQRKSTHSWVREFLFNTVKRQNYRCMISNI